ncbi:ATP-dependent RNA helicase [Corynebacterium hadale]
MFDLAKIGKGLPVADSLDQLPDSGPLVVQAPPGTGKTTLLPPAIANKVGKTIVTAPRRVAVRSAARRLAHLDGSALGQKVGYSIRGEHADGSLVEFVTPGVLLNRLLKDPGLEGVGAVILDEVHERQLDTDLVLAMCMEVAVLRDDLYLAAMSATLDAGTFAQHMGARVMSTEAVTHPLDIEYAPHPERVQGTRDFYRHVAQLAQASTTRTLVFVPGAREVDLVCGACADAKPLHGRLSSAEQDEALHGSSQVVVATSIAESSITVPGVRRVVDAGLSRVPKRDNRGMTGLVTVSEAVTSAEQRAGRAGRLGPGHVIRAFSREDFQKFAADISPEIATSDLTGAALAVAAWGSPDLPLLDQPPEQSLADAHATLRQLGALDADNAITTFGRKLVSLPLDPRLGAALLEYGSGAAECVARLGDMDAKRLARLVPHTPKVPDGDVIATAFPQWVAKRVGDEYLLASGTRATFAGKEEWIAAAEVQRTSRGAIIREAAPYHLPEARIEETVRATLHNGKVRGRKVRAVGAIELSSTPVKLSPEEAQGALKGISLEDLQLDDAAQKLKQRLDFLHEALGSPWPDVSRGDYSVEVGELAGGASISELNMRNALMRQLPWPEAAKLDELAPERLPIGRIDYSTGRPLVRVKLQLAFGLADSPVIAGRKLLFHLLSPAGRELAVTDDLRSFWDGPYQDVRKEMRGRYPKHPWPEDPWSATPTARTKKHQN